MIQIFNLTAIYNEVHTGSSTILYHPAVVSQPCAFPGSYPMPIIMYF